MDLPVSPPVEPMLAKAVAKVPEPGSGGMLYEPKWDGFRCIVFRDGDEVVLGSRNGRPLTRYFPELVTALRDELPDRIVLDGEVVLPRGDRLDFDALQQRIHPADSRVRMLADQTPTSYVAFDLLALGDEALLDRPFGERRQMLESALGGAAAPIYLTAVTSDTELANDWLARFEGAGLDGIVAKPMDIAYVPNKRAMFKVKHERTADVVVAGYRWHKSGPVVGSLLLGLFDQSDRFQHIGVAASFSMARRRELVDELDPYRMDDPSGHPWGEWTNAKAHAEGNRMPGGPSRWSGGKDLSWIPLRPELVCEVAYDQMEGDRFRHTARFRRWRTDRDPESCRYDQLEVPVRYDLAEVLATR
ncbi:MAG: ATP-dependent DNA ligase [Streptosporangiales bacterium]